MEGMWKKMKVTPFHNLCLKVCMTGGFFVIASMTSVALAVSNASPNILMILTDDQGWGDVAAYGANDLKTPAMDSLIASGMRFNNFYANCPVCSPTRAALLSGMVPDKVGVPGVIRTHPENNWGFLRPDAILLPKPCAGT